MPKRARTRKATLVWPEEIETDGDSDVEKIEGNQQPEEGDHSDPDKLVQVLERSPSTGANSVHSTSLSLRKSPRRGIAPRPRPYSILKSKEL